VSGEGWREQATCRIGGPLEQPELFWPDKGEGNGARLALHICRSHCPVRRECDKEEGPRVTHPCVVGGRRWTIPNGGSGSQLIESRVTRPSWIGCPLCRVT
jgi:hypothetical protein